MKQTGQALGLETVVIDAVGCPAEHVDGVDRLVTPALAEDDHLGGSGYEPFDEPVGRLEIGDILERPVGLADIGRWLVWFLERLSLDHQLLQLGDGPAGVEPVADVALLGQAGRARILMLAAVPCSFLATSCGVVAAGLVIVGKDHDVAAVEPPSEAVRPFPGASGVAGRDQPQLGQPIGVFLAFDDVDFARVEQLGKPIGDLLNTLDPPGPAAWRGPLPEVLVAPSARPGTPSRPWRRDSRRSRRSLLRCRAARFALARSTPAASRIASKVQPAWHLSSSLPPSPSPMLRLAVRSSWAGQRAIQPCPVRFALSCRARSAAAVMAAPPRARRTARAAGAWPGWRARRPGGRERSPRRRGADSDGCS